MASEPKPPRLYDYDAERKRWLTTWYDSGGKRRSKSFGYDNDTTEKQAQARYNYWLMRFKSRPELAEPESEWAEYTITQLAADYLLYARRAFVKDGKPTSHVWNVRMAMRELRNAYGDMAATAMENPHLAKLRDAMIWRKGKSRTAKTVNGRLTIIKQAFEYARERGKVTKETLADIKAVGGLKAGRSQATESKPIMPVHEDVVEQTLLHLPEVVRDMVRVLNITGIRPEEICSMRGCEIEMGGEVWLYRPRHKMEHKEGKGTVVRFLGPKSQAIIKKYFVPDLSAYLFSPLVAHKQRLDKQRAGKPHRADKPRKPLTRIRSHYTTETFRRAIHYACKMAGITKWNPNQLRHAVGTRLRKMYGLEAASVQLGHKNMKTTEIYAEKNTQQAIKLAREVG